MDPETPAKNSLAVPDQGCVGPVAYILSAGPLRRLLATVATSTGAREIVGQKDKLSRGERGHRMAVLNE